MPRRKKLETELTENETEPQETKPSFFEKIEEEGELTVDVFQTPREIVIQTAVAGVKPEDLDISITEDMVNIKGRREREEAVEANDFFHQECYWGAFSRRIMLPQRVDANASQAIMKNHGILTIRLPKLEGPRGKRVQAQEV